VPSMSLFHRVPSFDFEGVGARRRRRWKRFVAFVAFLLSLGAIGGAVVAWAVELGFSGLIGQGLAQLAG
jgi:hypothetical protein